MFDIGVPELLIVLVIVVLVFGPGRLAKTMGEIGTGIRSFKDAFSADTKAGEASNVPASEQKALENQTS